MNDTDDLAGITGQPFYPPCGFCEGHGYQPTDPHRTPCPHCAGRGTEPRVRYGHPGDGEGK